MMRLFGSFGAAPRLRAWVLPPHVVEAVPDSPRRNSLHNQLPLVVVVVLAHVEHVVGHRTWRVDQEKQERVLQVNIRLVDLEVRAMLKAEEVPLRLANSRSACIDRLPRRQQYSNDLRPDAVPRVGRHRHRHVRIPPVRPRHHRGRRPIRRGRRPVRPGRGRGRAHRVAERPQYLVDPCFLGVVLCELRELCQHSVFFLAHGDPGLEAGRRCI
mmetsp:Transcript_51127/g.147531  ORF Transcript_51127/g.147531 Transcript_51127/m.147531 type:complete len:213 (+) Transcript_51127:14-652(+)